MDNGTRAKVVRGTGNQGQSSEGHWAKIGNPCTAIQKLFPFIQELDQVGFYKKKINGWWRTKPRFILPAGVPKTSTN